MRVALDDYGWAAGIATDLVNSAAEVWHGDEHLPDLDALVDFADHHPEPDGSSALAALARRAGPGELTAVHTLRTDVRALIDDPVRMIEDATALTASGQGVTLDPLHPNRTRWCVPLRDDATIVGALGLVCGVGMLAVAHTLGVDRFRACGSPTCRGAFIDTTRPGRRRYCMPGLCGNRINVANHRARHRETDPPATPRDRSAGSSTS